MALQLSASDTRAHKFGAAAPFRVGVEEELFLVEPGSGAIARRADVVLAAPRRFGRGRIVGELCDGVVELATPVCASADEAAARLAGLRTDVLGTGEAALLGAGLHPAAPFGDVEHRGGAHYDAVGDDTRGLLRQSAYCGVHVHVGMPDPETAIAAFNGMRKWVPLLVALSANSPFWHGRDSGLAAARTVVCHSVPRTRLPRAFRDWDDYCETVAELVRVAEIDGPSSIWWDLRPHAQLGTLEVRVLDSQSSLRDLEGLVALVHCLVVHEAVTADPAAPAVEILDEATYRALRDGLDARLSTGGPMRHVQDLARTAIDLASGYARDLGCLGSLRLLEELLDGGNGAIRQRRAFAAGGMPAVLDLLRRETADCVAGVPERITAWIPSA